MNTGFCNQALDFEALVDPKDALHTWKKRAWDRFSNIGIPHSKQEAFQYVSFKDFSLPALAFRPSAAKSIEPSSLLFLDGFFQGAQVPSPLVVLSLEDAMRTYGIFLQNRLARSLKEESDPFAVLNGALQGRGAFLYVPPNTRIEEPIEIQQIFTSQEMASPSLHIVVGKGSSIQIVQRISSQSSSPFCNAYIDISLDANASLFFGESQRWPSAARHFQSLRCTAKRDSRLHCLSLSSGASLSRSSIKVQLLEEHAEALLQGLWRLDGDHQYHAHVFVEHIAPHCRSRQHFKGVLKDASHSSFEGKIIVRPEAQKTEAYQINNNLLLNDAACANAKPNLEIFADDVKASHGATISQLKEEDLFYLRSRGLSLAEAKEILVSGFCADLLAGAPSFFKET